MCIYIYIYMRVCACVCVCIIYIYIYICSCYLSLSLSLYIYIMLLVQWEESIYFSMTCSANDFKFSNLSFLLFFKYTCVLHMFVDFYLLFMQFVWLSKVLAIFFITKIILIGGLNFNSRFLCGWMSIGITCEWRPSLVE